ncbi:PIR Superfamily Protein [Plasmodium ovale wallikeri]|uniref:PIR Superfamily Protein n=1 Tax=Plasmodium ovale wallikeri TaxID=864142 RepID=A0A1A9APE1_PLAOA|nr:PIR Superfamily Protein [Plasmodium ovale wallikeri]SBT57965.1 PIR Superfamily Protein [Plasmodium ovale wallikeri]
MTNDEIYDLCDEFPECIKMEALLFLRMGELGNFNDKCALIEKDYSGVLTESKDICVKFKYIATQFLNVTESEESILVNGLSFLNFWLNYQLKHIHGSIVSPKDFYDKLKKTDPEFDSEHKLKDKIDDIEENHLKNITLLYNLYEKYNTIQSIINTTEESEKNCIDHIEQCTHLFEKANKNCSTSNIKFCKALESFKGKYEYMFEDITHNNCKLLKLLPSVDYVDPSRGRIEPEEDYASSAGSHMGSGDQGISARTRNIVAVIFTLISFFLIFLILYKATPFGIYFNRKIKRMKEKWANIEHDIERKSIVENTEFQSVKEKSNELHMPYYCVDNS